MPEGWLEGAVPLAPFDDRRAPVERLAVGAENSGVFARFFLVEARSGTHFVALSGRPEKGPLAEGIRRIDHGSYRSMHEAGVGIKDPRQRSIGLCPGR